nr:hypothetical protein [uncultured Rhodopila sp.]
MDDGSKFDLGIDARGASFFDLYARGAVPAEAIDDWIGRWHDDPSVGGRELHAWLGLSLPEYQVWVYDADALPLILEARRSGQTLDGAVEDRLASLDRADGPVDGTVTRGLRGWLDRRAREAAATVG